MATDGTDSGSVFRLIYRSRLTVPPDDYRSAIASILDVARAKNPGLGITGALVVWDDAVVQTLEGEEGAVRGLYETIGRDSRHEQVEIVETTPGAERTFPRWSMAQVSDYDDADVPLQSQWEGGVDVDEMKPKLSPEQETLITAMRERVRGASA